MELMNTLNGMMKKLVSKWKRCFFNFSSYTSHYWFYTLLDFWISSSLYDFTILLPVVFGSLSAIVLFALVRVIGGTSAGFLRHYSLLDIFPLLIRSPIGWFKSEPLGLFFSLLAVYFFEWISSQNKKNCFCQINSAGIFTSLSISAWGGNQFFYYTYCHFFHRLPFVKSEQKIILWSIPSL